MAIGMLLFPSSLILASFATQLWHVLMTQGILLGIGAAFCFSASFMLPSQWFVRHRSLANGIGNTGSCVGALCLSPLAQHLIETLGYRNALRVLGAIVFVLLSLATVLARARYPPSSSTPTITQKSNNTTSLRSSPLFSTPFALGLIFSLLVPFGYVVPFYLMPTYAMQQVGASASMGAALVSIGMATGVISRLGSGFIGDRIGPINTLSILTLISAILIMVLWTFSHTLPLYGVYCAAIGLTAGTYFGLVPAVLARIAGMQYLYVSGAVAWMFISIGSLLGTPCVGKLQKDIGWTYAILFTGIAELIAALCMLAIRFTLDRRLCSKL
ncbi:MFS general substrate transporter [Lichtheimia hyalospora FSU 10163]|nr:MFS general substrate transporter [Lichtheimia hyalospora FSU 10163]